LAAVPALPSAVRGFSGIIGISARPLLWSAPQN
jgi:hypothetical protein